MNEQEKENAKMHADIYAESLYVKNKELMDGVIKEVKELLTDSLKEDVEQTKANWHRQFVKDLYMEFLHRHHIDKPLVERTDKLMDEAIEVANKIIDKLFKEKE